MRLIQYIRLNNRTRTEVLIDEGRIDVHMILPTPEVPDMPTVSIVCRATSGAIAPPYAVVLLPADILVLVAALRRIYAERGITL